jgi:hypothetical protein
MNCSPNFESSRPRKIISFRSRGFSEAGSGGARRSRGRMNLHWRITSVE